MFVVVFLLVGPNSVISFMVGSLTSMLAGTIGMLVAQQSKPETDSPKPLRLPTELAAQWDSL